MTTAEQTIDLVDAALRAKRKSVSGRPFVLGLCGAQGSGKSTVAEGLAQRLAAAGDRVALLSLDDLYLPREDRLELAQQVHPLLATRGAPGTHDVALGEAVIDACGGVGSVALPRFAKSVDTRCPPDKWPVVETPVDVVLFEGWCVGAASQPAAALRSPVNALEQHEDADGRWRRWVNEQLAEPYQRLFARIDMLVLLAAPDFSVVAGWRKQQEQHLRRDLQSRGNDVSTLLSDDEINRFVQHYQRLTQHILTEMPARADLVVRLDRHRRPASAPARASL